MPKLIRPDTRIADLHDRAFRAGVRISAVLAKADPPVPASTWARWLKGKGYTSTVMARLERALTQIIEEDEDAQG